MKIHEMIDMHIQIIHRIRQKAEQDFREYRIEGKRLHVVKNHGTWQYYIIEKKGDSNGTYLPVAQRETASQIAQRDYVEQILRSTSIWEQKLQAAKELLASVPDNPIRMMRNPPSLHPGKMPLITPYVLSDEEYVATWQQRPFRTKGGPGTMTGILTNRGEKVRSKSEKIIADRLDALHIPYRYEAPLTLKNGRHIYPDFTILDIAHRSEVILEHLGRLTEYKYALEAVERINWYTESGYIPGRTVFFTYECDTIPLTVAQIDSIAQQFVSRQ